MKIAQLLFSLVVLVLMNSCSNVRINEHPEWKQYFDTYGVENGCFEMYDNNKEIASYYNREGCSEQVSPISTFEIFNSLVALEIDVASNENMAIKWDGVETPTKEWNQDLSMVQAFKFNAVPYFKELAIRNGQNKMQYYLDTVHYGNAAIGEKLDEFWMNGTLKISADEQVGFIKRLYHSELPAFSERSQRIVRGMMLQDEGKNFRLYYKSAQQESPNGNFVWMVGYLEEFVTLQNPKTKKMQDIPHPHFFALQFTTKDNSQDINKIQLGILTDILKAQNVQMEK